jgi:hypothetical protein
MPFVCTVRWRKSVTDGIVGDVLRSLLFTALVLAALSCGGDRRDASPSPTEDVRRPEATEWYLRSISDDGTTIAFVYTMSGVASECEVEDVPAVTESDDQVEITAYKLVTTDTDRACTEELAYIDEVVELSQPLGDRDLVGCRPHKGEDADETCRDLERSRLAGVFLFSPDPKTPRPAAS